MGSTLVNVTAGHSRCCDNRDKGCPGGWSCQYMTGVMLDSMAFGVSSNSRITGIVPSYEGYQSAKPAYAGLRYMPLILSGPCAGVVAASSRSVTPVTLQELTFMSRPIRSLSTLKHCGVQPVYIVSSPSLLVKVGVEDASKPDSCQPSLAPARSCHQFKVKSPDSAAQPAIPCVIGEAATNPDRQNCLGSEFRGHRRRRHTFPSQRSFVPLRQDPFLFFICRRPTNRLFPPALARKAFNSIHHSPFRTRLPLPLR